MANRASIAARAQIASERVNKAIEVLSEDHNIAVPAPHPIAYRQPELKAAADMERVAGFLEQLAGITPVQDESPGEGTESTTDEPAETSDAPDSQPEAEEVTDEEPVFHGKPLSFYADLTDEQILDIDGIGEVTLKKIRAAQAK